MNKQYECADIIINYHYAPYEIFTNIKWQPGEQMKSKLEEAREFGVKMEIIKHPFSDKDKNYFCYNISSVENKIKLYEKAIEEKDKEIEEIKIKLGDKE